MNANQWTVYILCWLAGLACGSVASVVPTYLPQIASGLSTQSAPVSPAELGSVVQALFLFGWVFGGIALGVVADLRGRAPVLGVAILGAVVCTAITPEISSVAMLGVLRFLGGVCVGASMVVSTTLGVESMPPERRPVMMGILANSYAVGIVTSGILQSTHVSYSSAVTTFLVFGLVGAVFLTVIRRRAQGAPRESVRHTVASQLSRSRREILIGSTLFGCMLIALWAAFSWLPTWVSELFPGTDQGADVRGAVMMALGGGGILGSLLVGPLVALIGRLPGIAVCYAGAIAGSIWLYGAHPSSSSVVLAIVFGMSVFFGMSQALMSFFIPELFPQGIRATGVGLCFNIGRSVTALAMLQVGLVAELLGGFQQALFVTSAILVVGALGIPVAMKSNPVEHST